MSADRDKIYTQYGDGTWEDGRAASSRVASLEFRYTKKHLEGYIMPDSRVLEVGCATGYYGMYYAKKCHEYVGVDICPVHIEIFRGKIAESGLKSLTCQVGDAINLEGIPDESFDVELCLGPMYHLPKEERTLVFAQCSRVCKTSGIVAFAYINRIGVYAGACVHGSLREKYPNPQANDFILRRGVDDIKPDTFFFTTPEEMQEAAKEQGLVKLKNLATDFYLDTAVTDAMDDEKFGLFLELYDQMTSHESCTGMGNHALLVCRK